MTTGAYSIFDLHALSHGSYLGTVTFCSFILILLLSFKACVFTINSQLEDEASTSLSRRRLHLKKSWGMHVLFLSSVVFDLGHIVVAYRTSCKARRKIMLHRIDPEAVLSCKMVFSSYQKVLRSPTPAAAYLLSTPLLASSPTSSVSEDVPIFCLNENCEDDELGKLGSPLMVAGVEANEQFGIVLVHGFGGGVFSWRKVMGTLARKTGCAVSAFDNLDGV
ncbi:hypothetical protein ACS0TY_011231 [Phlomoides rotata]